MRYSLKSSFRHGRFIVCISFFLQIPSLLSGKMNPVRHRGQPNKRVRYAVSRFPWLNAQPPLQTLLSRSRHTYAHRIVPKPFLFSYIFIDRHPPHVVRRLIILTTTNPPHGKTHWKHMVRAGCLISQTYNISARSTATRSARRFVRSFDTLYSEVERSDKSQAAWDFSRSLARAHVVLAHPALWQNNFIHSTDI